MHLEFGPGHTLVIGRNGVGKTSLLRLIDAVTRLDFSAFATHPFPHDLSFCLRWGELTLSMNLASNAPAREGGRRTALRFDGKALGSDDQSVEFEVGPGKLRGGHTIEEDEERPDPYEVNFRIQMAFFLSSTPHQAGDEWLRPLSPVWNYLTSANGRFDEALESFRIATETNGKGHAELMIADIDGQPRGLAIE